MNNQEKTTYSFKSETKELMQLMIHSLYSNKEIFLRELISNASDAIDKLRYFNLSSSVDHKNDQFEIKILIDTINNQLTIIDNGIGMNKKELIENLGTIAKSGTKHFLKSLKKEKLKENNLIGKFGVGFYSSFIVSKKVLVHTKSAIDSNSEGLLWESLGSGDYSIKHLKKETAGTSITLQLKEKEKEFLEEWKIKNTVNKYSDHINVPILLKIEKKEEKEEKEEKEKKGKKEEKENNTWKQINQAQALWTKQQSKISDLEYINFYKHLTNDSQDPLVWSHNKVEGEKEYISLLYVPKIAPWDLWNRDNKKGLKLYVKRVFIMDDAEQFLPNYLRFVRGLIDSNDLPLNISREILQNNHIINSLKKAITKRILKLLNNMLDKHKEKYIEFWNQFGPILKEGPAEDPINKETISKLLLFSSINNKSKKQTVLLKDYVDNMPSHQEKIYFITAESYEAAINSPLLEVFKKKSIDVLLLSERIDEWMMNYLNEFENKKFQSVSKSDDSLNKLFSENKNNTSTVEKKFTSFIQDIKKILGNKVEDVRITHRLTNSPSVLLTNENEMSTQMAKLFLSAGQKVPPVKYILEINPKHKLIKKISAIQDTEELNEWVKLLFEQALLIERGNLKNPNGFISRMNKFLTS
ncbi:Chaperone protein HtpG [Buchnera aphidicola (Anoecia corni)]|uniref:Chaperone protein HtpG n=1 Tax=Buchnera aphidicola (Anoecia corni) TaxID=2994477 RepID=A0AAT9IHD0_9GAMM